MAYNTANLLHDLESRGYIVTARQIVDWTHKRLMPGPRQRGMGYGRGSVYTWPDPGILDQVMAICDLLNEYRRVNAIRLPLWLLGYNIESTEACHVMRERLQGLEKWLTGYDRVSSDPDDAADQVSDRLCRLPERVDGPDFSAETPTESIELLVNVVANPGYEIKLDILQYAVEEFNCYVRDSAKQHSMPSIDELLVWMPVLLRHLQPLSVPKLIDAVTQATDADLETAHADWMLICGWLWDTVAPLEPIHEAVLVLRRMQVFLGTILIPVDLVGRQSSDRTLAPLRYLAAKLATGTNEKPHRTMR
jgi:hypothetical protein